MAIEMASKDKLPSRPGRSYPRRAHPQRPKSTKFMQKQANSPRQKDEKPPPDDRK